VTVAGAVPSSRTWKSKAAASRHRLSRRLLSFKQKIPLENRDLPRCFLKCVTWKYCDRAELGPRTGLRRRQTRRSPCPLLLARSPGCQRAPSAGPQRVPLCRLLRSIPGEERGIIAQVSTRLQLPRRRERCCWGGRVGVAVLEPPDRNSSLHGPTSRSPWGRGAGGSGSSQRRLHPWERLPLAGGDGCGGKGSCGVPRALPCWCGAEGPNWRGVRRVGRGTGPSDPPVLLGAGAGRAHRCRPPSCPSPDHSGAPAIPRYRCPHRAGAEHPWMAPSARRCHRLLAVLSATALACFPSAHTLGMDQLPGGLSPALCQGHLAACVPSPGSRWRAPGWRDGSGRAAPREWPCGRASVCFRAAHRPWWGSEGAAPRARPHLMAAR